MIESIAKKYLENPDQLPVEYIQQGFDFAQNYCDENGLKLNTFIKDKNNIELISTAIHKTLPLKVRFFLKEKDIASLLNEHHDWILNKFKELNKAQKSAKTPKSAKV